MGDVKLRQMEMKGVESSTEDLPTIPLCSKLTSQSQGKEDGFSKN